MLIRILAALTLVAIAPPLRRPSFAPAAEDAVGENYHIEVSYGWWDAEPELIVNSESLGILGTDVDLVSDLGIEKHRLGKLDIVLRPAKKHRLKFEHLPITYERDSFPVKRSSSSTASATRWACRSPPRSNSRPIGSATSTTSCIARAASSARAST